MVFQAWAIRRKSGWLFEVEAQPMAPSQPKESPQQNASANGQDFGRRRAACPARGGLRIKGVSIGAEINQSLASWRGAYRAGKTARGSRPSVVPGLLAYRQYCQTSLPL